MKTKILVFFIVASLLVSFNFAQAQNTVAMSDREVLIQTIHQQIQSIKQQITQLQEQLIQIYPEYKPKFVLGLKTESKSETGKLQQKTISITVSNLVPIIQTLKGYDTIEIDDYDFTHEISAPRLPIKNFSFVVPEEIIEIKNIKVVSFEKEVLRGEFNIFPSQEPIPLSLMDKDDSPDFTSPSPSIYKSSNAYPGRLLKYTGDGYLRDYHILSFDFYPVQYNPAGKKLTLYKNVDIDITYTVLPSESKKKIKKDEFTTMAKGMVDNPEEVEELFITTAEATSETLPAENVEYIIITKEFLESEFQVLLDHKINKGLTGKIVLLSWIKDNYTGTDTQEQIRNFLKDARETWNTKWVLLGGDTNVIPHRLLYSQYNPMGYDMSQNVYLPADIYYSGLDGNTGYAKADLYPDVFVGRAPVDTITETQTFVDKTIAYEKGPAGYETTALFLAEYITSNTDDAVTKKLIKRKSIPKHFSVTELYESKGTLSFTSAMRELNVGYGIVNHGGHAWDSVLNVGTGLQIRDYHIKTLTNSGRNYVFYSTGCYSNAMDKNSVAEHFIFNPNGGAVAYIGNSRYGITIPGDPANGPSDVYDKSFFNSLFNKGITNIGEAFADSKLALVSSCSHPADCSYRYLQYGLNLLGDPEMKIWTSKDPVPSKLLVSTESPLKVNQGDPFVVNTEILYYGDVTATGVKAVLTLPTGLSASNLTKPINDMLPGHLRKISWNVNADTVGVYDITVTTTATNVPTVRNTIIVEVITPDLTPPTITPHSPADNITVGDNENVVFKYTPNDAQGISSCELITNGLTHLTDYEIEKGVVNEFTTLMTAGIHTWKVNCTDDSPDANIGASAERTLTVEDRTPPTDGSITIEDIDGYTNDTEPSLQISAIGASYMAFSCNTVFTDWIKYTESYSSFNMETGAGCSLGDGEKTIYVKFKDEDDNESVCVSDITTLDRIAPKISGVGHSDITSATATIEWTTDEISSSVINYGTTTLLGLTASGGMFTIHSVTLTNLLPETIYYYEVKSSDFAGNSAIDNNGGLYYTFTTALPKKMHIQSIDMSTAKIKSGGWKTYSVAAVTIVEANGSPVEGATVYGRWTLSSGTTPPSISLITNINGQATTNSWGVKNARGTFTFRVDNVTKEDCVYDSSANIETSGSITVAR